MKRMLYFNLLVIVFHAGAYSQKLVHHSMRLPQKLPVITTAKTNNDIAAFIFLQRAEVTPPQNRFISLLNALPFIKFKEPANNKLPVLLTELSFGEIAESIFEKANSSLLNTYDDTIPELFKDAPFSVKITCIIRL